MTTMATKCLGALDVSPMWSPNQFDPLGRDLRKRGEAAPVVQVIEERHGERVLILIVTRNR